jgi:hypothetical protein
MIICYDTGKATQDQCVNNFAQGCQGTVLTRSQWESQGLPANADEVAVQGIMRLCGLIYKDVVASDRTLYFIDHAYFSAGYQSPGWMRVTKNRHAVNKITEIFDPHRFNRHFRYNYNIQSWNASGDYILILPPTNPVQWFFNCGDWLDSAIACIRQHTDMPIRVRHKPNQVFVDDRGFKLPDAEQEKLKSKLPVTNTSMSDDIAKAAAVVVYNSVGAIDATVQGKPVICTGHCPAWPIGFDFEDLETAKIHIEPNRETWFQSLACAQFSQEEFISGMAYRITKEMQ